MPRAFSARIGFIDELDCAARDAEMTRSEFVRRAVTDKIQETAQCRDAALAALDRTLKQLPSTSAAERRRLERAAMLVTELIRAAHRHRRGELLLDRAAQARFVKRFRDLQVLLRSITSYLGGTNLEGLVEAARNWATRFARELGEDL